MGQKQHLHVQGGMAQRLESVAFLLMFKLFMLPRRYAFDLDSFR